MNIEILKNVNFIKVNNFDIKRNGIQLVESEKYIEIHNDPLRTEPLFITKDNNNKLIVFSKFEDFYQIENIDRVFDEAGFWEIVLFGSGLWTRTLYKNVDQMPGASKIIFDKKTNNYEIKRYWDYNVEEDKSIDSIEMAAYGLYNRLDKIFSNLDREQKYILGMSGGLDSRITLAFLSKYLPKENLKLFTYGFDERILEYEFSKEIAIAFGYERPIFHQLKEESYRKAMNYLPKMSGGQIGIGHCHILDFLQKNDNSGYRQISTYFSDAIFGYECSLERKKENINGHSFIQKINKANYLSDDLKNKMIIDTKKLFDSYSTRANYSSLDEYKYITERNQKFHTFLASIQKRFIETDIVYADFDLLTYVLSIPLKFRAQKKLIDYILDNKFDKISSKNFRNISSRDFKVTSSKFQWGGRSSGIYEWYFFKLLNRANAILRPLTKGRIQIFNKYQTEEQERLLYSAFIKELSIVTSKFLASGLISPVGEKFWNRLPLKSNGIGERFNLISLGQLA